MTPFNDATTLAIAEAMELPEDEDLIQRWGSRDTIQWYLTDLVEVVAEEITNIVSHICEDVKLLRAQELLALRSRPV